MRECPASLEHQREKNNEAQQKKWISDGAPVTVPWHPSEEGGYQANIQDEGDTKPGCPSNMPAYVVLERS
jgi:hypothetical protein